MKLQWALLLGFLVACGRNERPSQDSAESTEGEAVGSGQPHRVMLEIDRMEGVSPIPLTQNIGGRYAGKRRWYEHAKRRLKARRSHRIGTFSNVRRDGFNRVFAE